MHALDLSVPGAHHGLSRTEPTVRRQSLLAALLQLLAVVEDAGEPLETAGFAHERQVSMQLMHIAEQYVARTQVES